MSPIIWIIICVAVLALGILVGYILRKNIGERPSAVQNRKQEI